MEHSTGGSDRGRSVNERHSLTRYLGRGEKTRVDTLKVAVKQVRSKEGRVHSFYTTTVCAQTKYVYGNLS